MTAGHQRLHALVRGRVQGVGFRYATFQEGQRLGVTGWVRNRPDGAVEVTAEGPTTALEHLLAFLHSGPSAARVQSVQPQWSPAAGDLGPFDVRV